MTAASPLGYQSPAAPSRVHDGMLRLIGAYKLVKSLVLMVAAVTAARLMHRDAGDFLLNFAHRFHVAPGNRQVRFLVEKSFAVSHRQWAVLAGVFAAYSVMFFIEGVGLLLAETWAEWMTVITTSGLIPFEFYEYFRRPTFPKLLGMEINIAVAIYLIVRLTRRNPGKTVKSS
jgi:uncharacterized membrane protein (DUF2068 family)